MAGSGIGGGLSRNDKRFGPIGTERVAGDCRFACASRRNPGCADTAHAARVERQERPRFYFQTIAAG